MSDALWSVKHHWKKVKPTERMGFLVDTWVQMTPTQRGEFIERVNATAEKGTALTVYPVDQQGVPLIPRKAADLLAQQHIEKLRQSNNEILEFAQDVQRDKDKLSQAQSSVSTSLNSLFSALAFTDSASWKGGLKSLLDEYNKDATTARAVIREIAQKYTDILRNGDRGTSVTQTFLQIEASLMMMSNDVNEAVTKATAEDDGGGALLALASTITPKLNEMLDAIFANMPTSALALDRNFSAATRYIGYHCNVLEAEGTTGNRKQWMTIYQRLKAREDTCSRDRDNDALAALEYFRQVRPYDMQVGSDELRRFEKQVSTMKSDMKSYSRPPGTAQTVRRTKEGTKQ